MKKSEVNFWLAITAGVGFIFLQTKKQKVLLQAWMMKM